MMGHESTKKFIAGLIAGLIGGTVVGYQAAQSSKAAWRKYRLRMAIEGLESEIFDRLVKTKRITEEAYVDIVDEVVDSYAELKKFSEDKAQRISAGFKARFRDMQKLAKESAQRAKEELDAQTD